MLMSLRVACGGASAQASIAVSRGVPAQIDTDIGKRFFTVTADVVAPRLVVPDLNTMFGAVALHSVSKRYLVISNVGNATVSVTVKVKPVSRNDNSDGGGSSEQEGADSGNDDDASATTDASAFEVSPSVASIPARQSARILLTARPTRQNHAYTGRLVLETTAGDYHEGTLECTGGGPLIDAWVIKVGGQCLRACSGARVLHSSLVAANVAVFWCYGVHGHAT